MTIRLVFEFRLRHIFGRIWRHPPQDAWSYKDQSYSHTKVLHVRTVKNPPKSKKATAVFLHAGLGTVKVQNIDERQPHTDAEDMRMA